MDIIVVDDAETWPPDVANFVRSTAERVRGKSEYLADLPIGYNAEDEFAEVVGHRSLLAHHATRLLSHEAVSIRQHGLRALTPELISDRLTAALEAGAITAEQFADLRFANVFCERDRTASTRRDDACLFLSRTVLVDAGGIWPLLTEWGGEGIYMSGAGYKLRPFLKTLGVPAIVVAAVDTGGQYVHPSLLRSFVGAALGENEYGSAIHHRGTVPAERIIDVWQPGHPSFDRYPELLKAV